MYRLLVSVWDEPALVVVEGKQPISVLDDAGTGWQPAAAAGRMMTLDARSYLPDDILVKIDRATMAVSLEARVPFLDHRVVELAARVPHEITFSNGGSKMLLRSILDRYVPERLVERPKAGFDLPVGEWLRGPLRHWADELLEPERLRHEGYLRPEPVTAAWHEHLSRRRDHEYRLWTVLMFQAWREATKA
jgi:asparagine synthase (glutamine-hydrolysing)